MDFSPVVTIALVGGAGWLLWRTHEISKTTGSENAKPFMRRGLPRNLGMIERIERDLRRPNRYIVHWKGRNVRSKIWTTNPKSLHNQASVLHV